MVAPTCELTPERILAFVDRHFCEPIAPRDVASALHYSLCHVTHVARKSLGVSLTELIFRRRIAEAQRLLAETALPVCTVAKRVGFADGAYFTRRFTRASGTSPTLWRRRHARRAARSHCHACGAALPLVPPAQNEPAQTRAAAS